MTKLIDVAPSPITLIQSLRDIGYSIETAVADIIDNSITAKARVVRIRFGWNAGEPWLAIIDDGLGMVEPDLINAMRFGSTDPLEPREADDLGRFGLGLKTASLSQCRHLTVVSWKNGMLAGCEWNLDVLAQNHRSGWMLGVLDEPAIRERKNLNSVVEEYIMNQKSGTVVFWENIDRLKEQGPAEDGEKHLDALIHDTRRHLELVFHRFLSPDRGQKKRVMEINGDPLIPYNPFNPLSNATLELEQQIVTIDGSRIAIQPFVLPHSSKVSREEYERYAGEGGYLNNQGFYVYRNRRLIIKGTWFRLAKKAELNKLIRIKVDLPNTLDHLWQIDVRKSQAAPPEPVRLALKQIIQKIEISGQRVFRQRGRKLLETRIYPVWDRLARGGAISYAISREHPLIREFQRGLSEERRRHFERILSVIESSFPREAYYNDVAGTPDQVVNPEMDAKNLEKLIDIFLSFWQSETLSNQEIVERLLTSEPFASNPDTTQEVLMRRGLKSHD